MAAGPITVEEFEQLPLALVVNHELIDGELVDVSGNTPLHNLLRDLLVRLLGDHVERNGLGTVIAEQEYEFDQNVHGPHLSFFVPAKRGSLNLSARVQRFVPDLAIEIASPNDKFTAILQKCDRYRACGVQETWLISAETRRIFVSSGEHQRMLGEDDALTSPLLPGFSITLRQLIARLP